MVTFGEPLGHVITRCGEILVSRTDDDRPKRPKTCARGAGTHGDVLNVHTGTFWVYTRGFHCATQHTPRHTTQHNNTTQHNMTHHNNTTTTPHGDRDRETETDRDRERQRRKTGTGREEKMVEERQDKRGEKREDEKEERR